MKLLERLPKLRGIILVHGLWAGWAAVLLLGRYSGIRFQATQSALGIIGYCTQMGFPKQADYFWYAMMLAGGLAGAAAAAVFPEAMRRLEWRGRFERWPAIAGFLCLAAGSARAFLQNDSAPWLAWVLLAAGWALPWLDRSWYREAPALDAEKWVPPSRRETLWWAAASLAISWLVTFDSCLPFRPIDGLHEGGQLVYVQSWLAGELPGLDVKNQYGILYSHSIAWWMSVFGMTMSVMRGYFIFVQALGTMIHLLILRGVCRSLPCIVVGTWLMLALSPVPNIQFGWANSLRTALPLAALWLCWRGTTGNGRWRIPASGAIAAIAWLYSSDYGMAGFAACLVLIAGMAIRTGPRIALVQAAWWAVTAAATWLLVLTAVFGTRTGDALTGLTSGGYGLARMLGHGALPLPAFPWWSSWGQFMGRSGILRDLTGIWAPGMLCVAAIAWLTIGRRRALPDRSKLIWALILFTLLSQIPVLARPLSQIGTSMPPAIILFVILADVLLRGGRGAMAASAAGLALACFYGFAVLDPMIFALRTKYIYVGYPKSQAGIPLERLGTVKLRRAQAKETMELVEEIRKLCPPGGRVYLAAHWHSHLIFLADRAALGPYALTYLAATESQRRDVVAALEKARPPAALAARRGIDLDFAVEHPEEWEWLQANYRPLRTVGEVTIWAPK